MHIPTRNEYARSYVIDKLLGNELEIGDVVYYLSPSARYAIKKSKITAKKELPINHHFGLLGGCELKLADGSVVQYQDVFCSKEDALVFIVADLKSDLAHSQIALQTIQHEIQKNERLLTFYEKKLLMYDRIH